MNSRFGLFIVLLSWFSTSLIYGQSFENQSVLTKDQFHFLEELTLSVLEASRIYPKQFISDDFGANNTGGILIRPGGRNAYPSFWIRDYAMALETGMISASEQKSHADAYSKKLKLGIPGLQKAEVWFLWERLQTILE